MSERTQSPRCTVRVHDMAETSVCDMPLPCPDHPAECQGCAKGLPRTASSDYQSERIAIDTALVRLAAQLGVTVPVDVSGAALVELIAKEVAG